jgi:hypothetical protein
LLENTRLLGDGHRTFQLGVSNGPYKRFELFSPHGIIRAQAHEHLPPAGHDEKVFDHGEWQLLCFSAVRIDVPIRLQPFLNDFPKLHQFFEVQTWRRQHDAEDKVAVACRQIFNFRPHQPR